MVNALGFVGQERSGNLLEQYVLHNRFLDISKAELINYLKVTKNSKYREFISVFYISNNYKSWSYGSIFQSAGDI